MAAADPDQRLIDRSVALAAELLAEAAARSTAHARRRDARLGRLLGSDEGTALVFALVDRALRPVDAAVAVGQLAEVAAGDLSALGPLDRLMLRAGARAGPALPAPVMAMAGARLRRETSRLIFPLADPGLRLRLAGLRRAHRRPNLNLLGEAILGDGEAAARTAAVEGLLRRPDVDCVSVKASSVASGLSLVDFEGSLRRVEGPVRRLYRAALAGRPPKLVNLDMEEHTDLDLTVAVFTGLLDEPELMGLEAGIALQAYLPDSHAAAAWLVEWARARVRRGGAGIRIRVVKGANLAMERVRAEVHDWPLAPYGTKEETDASFKAIVDTLLRPATTAAVRVGVASHNLFDLAFALTLAADRGVSDRVEVEMLAGMADHQAAAVAERRGRVLVYVPVTGRRDFRNAIAYLARRLDENTTPDGFLRHIVGMSPGGPQWEDQRRRFAEAVRSRHGVDRSPRQTQDRTVEAFAAPATFAGRPADFSNEPDTDLSVAANRTWALSALAGGCRRPRPRAADVDAVETTMTTALGAAARWGGIAAEERRGILLAAAGGLARGRAEAVAVMAAEAGKTFAQGDPEVSEAVDYARWYAWASRQLEGLDASVASGPLGVVVVSPPWNFPFAIPAGGVLAALAAGNAAVLKPSPEAVAPAGVLHGLLTEAGVPGDVVQLCAAPDDDAGRRLVTHPAAGAVVLTGSFATARMFQQWRPDLRLLAETSGKNAVVVTATADVDQAVRDLVTSAFGHAGQKCSAASLAIVDSTVHDRSPFLRQLADATRSLRVGPASDPATEVGPLVGPFTPELERALTRLDPGETWLVMPRRLDDSGRLWSPGVRTGVRQRSWAHTTEWFGPVLGVMRCEGLDEALAWQNAVAYGLTAGLQSLDPDEQARWVERVEAGNVYVNRPTSGALVGRQPFGGWKRSAFGPTAKAGGPNYLFALTRWWDGEVVTVEAAAASYRRWWDRHFGVATETAGLRSESNLLRYRPLPTGVLVRASAAVDDDELAKAATAAAVAGTRMTLSSPVPRAAPSAVPGAGAGGRPGTGVDVVVESDEALAARLASVRPDRLRLLGGAEAVVLAAAAAHGLSVLPDPVVACGRVELLRWTREQVVTRSRHRYGNIVG
ncbi:MAG TPA: bifunctional proline dehydrogenase/L-glutamate gamma-semialdehyde dehydrogenase [Acidimicrobiales bacterium]|nr:bifunctional proline dehydrogenase/L-glutamate gamma-semialdehyde dehydrogenase [Acidimicrobiales bacterium]